MSSSIVNAYIDQVHPVNYADDVLEHLHHYSNNDLSFYSDIVKASFVDLEPIFTHRVYAETFWNCASTIPGWLAQLVIGNAHIEMDGGVKLGRLSNSLTFDKEAKSRILTHSGDERRHAHLYLQLASLAFPLLFQKLECQMKASLTDLAGQKDTEEELPTTIKGLFDCVIQINMIEMRTRTNLRLLAPLLYSFAPQENQSAIQRILESLVKDEIRHIGYTAKLIDTWGKSGEGKYIGQLYKERLAQFNQITIQETQLQQKELSKNFFQGFL